MRCKIMAVGLSLLVSGLAYTQQNTYTVRQGDTISGIASRLKVKRADLVALNGLENPHKLKLGLVLRVPTSSAAPVGPTPDGSYIVRNGDYGWTIARKHNLSLEKLSAMNPNVKLDALQPGTKLHVRAATEPTVTVKAVRLEDSPSKSESTKVAVKPSEGTNKEPAAEKPQVAANDKAASNSIYAVAEGDNDWIIAHKFGTSSSKIRELNPNVDWRRLQIGTKIKVAGAAGASAEAVKPSRIASKYAIVNGDNATIRRGPGTTFEKVTLVPKGTEVTVLDHESGWYKLKFPKGTIGWMRGDLLTPMSLNKAVKVSKVGRTERRKERIARASTIKSPTKPKTLVASKPKPSKSKGATLVASAAPVDRSDLLDKAMSLRGTRYRWGGTSRSGFDCSGFVGTVYKSQGVKLPRTSRDMAAVGSKVPKGQLQPGDLVFFKTRRSSRINHVGIYAGNGKFIHSSSGKGRVRVDSLREGYYASRLVTAKRVASKSKPTAKPSAKVASKAKSDAPAKVVETSNPAASSVEMPKMATVGD